MAASYKASQRILKILELKFNFIRYFKMIDGRNTVVTEPTVFLFNRRTRQKKIIFTIPVFQCFFDTPKLLSKSVKLVTKALTHVFNSLDRNEHIKTI